MNHKKPQSIILSGSVFLRSPAAPRVGDLVVLLTDDTRTRDIGRKKNQFSNGFSGYLIAYIFDGHDWGRLELWRVLADSQLRYQFRYQGKNRAKTALAPLQRLSGRVAVRSLDDAYGRYMFKFKPDDSDENGASAAVVR